jgi:membrane-bound metal-dependent hydrolase YbcI (DUF457 family)
MLPDLEIPILQLLFMERIPHRLVLHSLLGSATIGTFFAILITIWVYPSLVSAIFGVEKKAIVQKCKLSSALAFSAFVGLSSHVLLDVTNHPYNPVFWPFLAANATPSPFYFALGVPLGSLWMQGIMGTILTTIVIFERKHLFPRLLVG